MNTKKTILCFVVALLLYGCATADNSLLDVNAMKYVELPDYHSISVSSDYLSISSSDVENIISWDLTSNDVYIVDESEVESSEGSVVLMRVKSRDGGITIPESDFYYEVGEDDIFEDSSMFIGCMKGQVFNTSTTGMSNERIEVEIEILGLYRYPEITDTAYILDFYNLGTMEEIETFIRDRASGEILYHYIWDYILDNARILDWPRFIKGAVRKSEDEVTKEMSYVIGDTSEALAEYHSYITNFYRELLVSKAVLDNEGIVVTKDEIDNAAQELQEQYGITSEEAFARYEDNIYKSAIEKKLRELIIMTTKVT